jgi:hypothetical protein
MPVAPAIAGLITQCRLLPEIAHLRPAIAAKEVRLDGNPVVDGTSPEGLTLTVSRP